jgi:hypothetical protein
MQPGHPHLHGKSVPRTCPASATAANGTDVVSLSPPDGENMNGRISMQAAASSNLLLTDLSSFSGYGELQEATQPRRILPTNYFEASQRRSKHADFHGVREQACSFSTVRLWRFGRCVLLQMRAVKDASELLVNLPLGKEYQSIGRYYQALCKYQRGRNC